jgi:hypothetical protein
MWKNNSAIVKTYVFVKRCALSLFSPLIINYICLKYEVELLNYKCNFMLARSGLNL